MTDHWVKSEEAIQLLADAISRLNAEIRAHTAILITLQAVVLSLDGIDKDGLRKIALEWARQNAVGDEAHDNRILELINTLFQGMGGEIVSFTSPERP